MPDSRTEAERLLATLQAAEGRVHQLSGNTPLELPSPQQATPQRPPPQAQIVTADAPPPDTRKLFAEFLPEVEPVRKADKHVPVVPEQSAPVESAEGHSNQALPPMPATLPPVLTAAPPVRPIGVVTRRSPFPPAHPSLAKAAPPALAQPRKVAPRLADPNQKPFDVRFVPAPPIADDGSVEGPAPQLTTRTSLNKDAGKMPPSPEDSAVFSLMGKANDAVSTGDLKQAIVLLSDVLDFQPSHLNARLSRGRCWRELGEFSAALSDFHRAQDSAPMSAAPTYEVANLFFAQKAYNKAIDAYGSAIELDEEHAMAHCRRGICHHFRGHPESAKRDLLEATRLNAEIPNIRRYLRMVDKRNG